MKNINPNSEVLVLDSKGEKLGNMSYREAQIIAQNEKLDLVFVNKGEFLVYKIMDLGKWKYSQKKNNKKPVQNQLKEMKFKMRIDPHDAEIKINHIRKFLSKGDDVLIGVIMRGREKANPKMAQDKMDFILEKLKDISSAQQIRTGNSSVTAVLHPIKNIKDQGNDNGQDQKHAQEKSFQTKS